MCIIYKMLLQNMCVTEGLSASAHYSYLHFSLKYEPYFCPMQQMNSSVQGLPVEKFLLYLGHDDTCTLLEREKNALSKNYVHCLFFSDCTDRCFAGG